MLERLHSYIGECCREWILAAGFTPGTCGLCGERPTFKRYDTACTCGHCENGVWSA